MDLNALRNKPARFVIGLMSGSSCDGIDAILVRIRGTGPNLRLNFVRIDSYPYPPALKTKLLSSRHTVQDICLLNFELGERFAEAVLETVRHARAEGFEVDLVASHGHTVAHVPPRADKPFGSLQIGEPAIIAERTGLPVVSDFRPRDMAAGGQGAPLVPYADWVLFAREEGTMVFLNIGGICNFTVVTPRFDGVIAFDVGPGNMAIDGAVRLLTRGEKELDEDGAMAAKGMIVDEFLQYLMSDPYFEREPPKSTGREEFGADVYLRDALASRREHAPENLVATVTESVARNIGRAYNNFIRPKYQVTRLIISGGGAYNKTLINRIRQLLHDVKVRTSDHYGIPPNAREAVAFAVLANETIFGTPNNVPQATGARHPVVLGKITPND